MKQYSAIKEQYPDMLILFQVGDFYELFYEDAKKASSFLGITLTTRGTNNGEPIPLCGVPVHAIDLYCNKLVKGGFKVALCDQLTEAQPGKVVERGVTQVLTPGTLTNTVLLDEKKASYLCTIALHEETVALWVMELLTAQLWCITIPLQDEVVLEAELARFSPDEIIVTKEQYVLWESLFYRNNYTVTQFEYDSSSEVYEEVALWARSVYAYDVSHQALKKATSLWYQYVKKNSPRALQQCVSVEQYATHDFLFLDAGTQKNLELVVSADGTSADTLFSVLDCAATSMGSRLIKKWITRPLQTRVLIENRLNGVQALIENYAMCESIARCIEKMGDVERIVGRIGMRRATVNDYHKIMNMILQLPQLDEFFRALPAPYNKSFYGSLHELGELLVSALHDDTAKPWRIKTGYNNELDRLRMIIEHGAQSIIEFEKLEQQKTGISSLKVRYNRSGYGIEITNANAHLVPGHYIRLQTLVNRERFTTQELKDLEYDIQHAHTACEEIEELLFSRVKLRTEEFLDVMRQAVSHIAYIDALIGFARAAYTHQYVRPQFHTSRDISIKEGRHPVIEASLKHPFIQNDTTLTDQESLWIITGPNMGGKSTYMRQVALIIIMAQCGSYVPAHTALLPIVDRIFTRIGAADNLAEGKSTFLVEMEETALICKQATEKSVVILDEVGRGTSTYDGLAIAQAVVEYLYTTVKARCLFATHYHELVELALINPGIVAYHAASKQTESGVVLLHKIVPGEAEGSFGIEVARRAQLPVSIIQRAQELMVHFNTGSFIPVRPAHRVVQKSEKSTVEKMIGDIDYDSISPKQALDILYKLKELV